ncbi:photosystem II reaction center protein PsbN [Prochlorothrix hollandica]|uniref:Protein PsbN n=1 Tax=Prochlorothrix hollandica PCC 9006 = CALU 1027 TaxID=317619 RepID=A0A0M2Q225_PROHO|nr:photosystem II reaction center protein PsbN [Prochlorothrix hollandica]KKJ01313.1 protein psbN [Prochlorothrix hollandica PCC 9006 = CALU 1027]
MESSSPALSLGLTLAAIVIGLTGFSVYIAFGPPAKDLADPFEDHED